MKPFSSRQNLDLPDSSLASLADRAQASFVKFLSGSWMQSDETSERRSLMKFSELGTLDCLCHPDRTSAKASDRRMSCRVCGHEVRAKVTDDVSMLDAREIQKFVKQLNQMARRTAAQEFMPVIDTVSELAN